MFYRRGHEYGSVFWAVSECYLSFAVAVLPGTRQAVLSVRNGHHLVCKGVPHHATPQIKENPSSPDLAIGKARVIQMIRR